MRSDKDYTAEILVRLYHAGVIPAVRHEGVHGQFSRVVYHLPATDGVGTLCGHDEPAEVLPTKKHIVNVSEKSVCGRCTRRTKNRYGFYVSREQVAADVNAVLDEVRQDKTVERRRQRLMAASA